MSAGMIGSGCSVIFCRYTNHDLLDLVTNFGLAFD
jgi:hypothetical protein